MECNLKKPSKLDAGKGCVKIKPDWKSLDFSIMSLSPAPSSATTTIIITSTSTNTVR
jgi:hypothetical protein